LAYPFLRWAGGKRWLGSRLPRLTPDSFGTYFEPFLGAANAFFRLSPRNSVLSDINEELINAYTVLRDTPQPLIDSLQTLEAGSAQYDRIRALRPNDNLGRAVRFIYLNRTSWNGLYRVNSRGVFNVPYGWGDRPLSFDARRLQSASSTLRCARLTAVDFEESLSAAEAGDFAFVDPPYAFKRDRGGFLSYDKHVFSWTDQERLHEVLVGLNRRAVRFLLTEPDIPSIRRLFSDFRVRSVRRTSTIAANPSLRGPKRELIIRNYPTPPHGATNSRETRALKVGTQPVSGTGDSAPLRR